MTTAEMHQMFRNYAQQMGMQNVRAILPSQIDMLLNNSISDTVNQVIAQNIGSTSDRVITDNSKLNQVNALKSLIQVCYDLSSERTLKREVDSIIECAGELKCSNLIIVTMNEERIIEKNGYKVKILPIYKF